MFQEEGNSKENPAKYVVQNFKEAVDLIFQIEGLSGKGGGGEKKENKKRATSPEA